MERKGELVAEIVQAIQGGNVSAELVLLAEFIPLVNGQVREFARDPSRVEDLMQVGRAALVEAAYTDGRTRDPSCVLRVLKQRVRNAIRLAARADNRHDHRERRVLDAGEGHVEPDELALLKHVRALLTGQSSDSRIDSKVALSVVPANEHDFFLSTVVGGEHLTEYVARTAPDLPSDEAKRLTEKLKVRRRDLLALVRERLLH